MYVRSARQEGASMDVEPSFFASNGIPSTRGYAIQTAAPRDRRNYMKHLEVAPGDASIAG